MAVTVSELYSEYERDFQTLQEEVEALFVELPQLEESKQSKSLSSASKKIAEADQALKQMDMEAKTMPTHQRSALEPALRHYRGSLVEKRRRLANLRETVERQSLMGTGPSVYGRSQERDRMLQSNDKMEKATAQLKHAHQQSLEAESISMDVASDLRQQRDTIARARSNIGEVGSNYGMAKRIIESMQRRQDWNRLALRGVMCFMCLVLLVAAFILFGGGNAVSASAASGAVETATPPRLLRGSSSSYSVAPTDPQPTPYYSSSSPSSSSSSSSSVLLSSPSQVSPLSLGTKASPTPPADSKVDRYSRQEESAQAAFLSSAAASIAANLF